MNIWSKVKGFFRKNNKREEREKTQKNDNRRWWQFWKRKRKSEPEPEMGYNYKENQEKLERKKEEYEEKHEDEEKKRRQYEQARETANKRYGTNFTQDEYDKIWDTYGSSDLSQYFPSDVIIYAAEYAKQSNITFDNFVSILKEVTQNSFNQGWNREEASTQLWSALEIENLKYSNENGIDEYYDDLY